MKVELSEDMPPNLVRIPHGWWLPEESEGEPGLSGVWEHSDGIVLSDEDRFLDPEQGMPTLRGLLCKVYPV